MLYWIKRKKPPDVESPEVQRSINFKINRLTTVFTWPPEPEFPKHSRNKRFCL